MNLKTMASAALKVLTPREKEVVVRRFGLQGPERETLEQIGKDHDLTRERVRQIQEKALATLRVQSPGLQKVFCYLKDHLEQWGGLRREDRLLYEAGRTRFINEVFLFLHLGEDFERAKEDEFFHALWFVSPQRLEELKELAALLETLLENRASPLSFPELKDHLADKKPGLKAKPLQSYLEVTKIISQGPTGHYGLKHWPEINPRGVIDKSYIVLKYHHQPLHFREVTQKINQLFYQQGKSQKQALPQTVHNELIKDERFVLVGRGLYGLREWGFIPGTCKEIIVKVLQESGRPLTREVVLTKVAKQRLIKENTILLNLSDKKLFCQDGRGRYMLAFNK